MLAVAIHPSVRTMEAKVDGTSIFVDVFFGGWVGSGAAALVMWLLGGFFAGLGLGGDTVVLVLLNVFPHLAGGFVGSALVARKRRDYTLRTCLWTAVCSAVIWILITGHIGLYVVVGFLTGGYLRYVLARRASLRRG